MIVIKKSILKKAYKKRKMWARKGDYGHLLVVGGSKLYTGAPFLAGLAALRTGCDLVTVAAPERAANIAARNLNLITYPLKGDFIKVSHIRELLELSRGKDAIVIGNGIGRRKETFLAVNKFLGKISVPCVIDADAIHAVAVENRKKFSQKLVFTPHAHEFYILTGKKVTTDLKERIAAVKAVAKKLNATILLKGQVAVISDGAITAINRRISTYATKGGTGDVLAGACGSLLAQGIEPFYAACAASYIIGMAGHIAARRRKQSMMATDVIEKLPDAIQA